MTVTLNIAHKKPAREHLLFSDHMTAADFDHPIRETFLGQAHIAGTGPAGKTCRECSRWGKKVFKKREDGSGRYDESIKGPGYFAKSHKETPWMLEKAKCNRPIANKPKKAIPHFAKACRLFIESDAPASVLNPAKPK